MESPTTIPQYNSKKRMFPGGSSSGFREVEALGITPQINDTSKRNSSKQKEAICPEIIDVESEEDCGDIMRIDGEADTKAKGKEAVSSSSSVGFTSAEQEEFEKVLQASMEDYNSNMGYDDDDWVDDGDGDGDADADADADVDAYYDDMLFDEYDSVDSKFDNMDIPTGVEAPFPWLANSPKSNTDVLGSSTSTKSAGINLPPALNSSHSFFPLGTINQGVPAGGLQMPTWMGHGLSQKKSSTSSSAQFYGGDPLIIKTKRSRGFNPPPIFLQKTGSVNTYTPLHKPHGWGPLVHSMASPTVYMPGNAFVPQPIGHANNYNSASPILTPTPFTVNSKDLDEIMHKFDQFKRFDSVEDCTDHHYLTNGSPAKQPPKNWAKRIQDEWKILEENLPDTIFVRVYESRMDLMRAVMVGAEGTPYHDGLYFFDVYFPSTYPNVPPHVHYHSGGLRINPNLYNCGKVCLSLLGTWSGKQREKWIPGESTMLQVLVSIQGLILNAKPYFNEPGFEHENGSPRGEKSSVDYNEKVFMYTLQSMVYKMRNPPLYFEDYVIGHFCKHGRDILVSCKAYLEGAQVGCLVKGGVQDVDAGKKSCSQHFKINLGGFMNVLVNEFIKIGAKDCEEFLSLAHKGTDQVITAAGTPHHPPPPLILGKLN